MTKYQNLEEMKEPQLTNLCANCGQLPSAHRVRHVRGKERLLCKDGLEWEWALEDRIAMLRYRIAKHQRLAAELTAQLNELV